MLLLAAGRKRSVSCSLQLLPRGVRTGVIGKSGGRPARCNLTTQTGSISGTRVAILPWQRGHCGIRPGQAQRTLHLARVNYDDFAGPLNQDGHLHQLAKACCWHNLNCVSYDGCAQQCDRCVRAGAEDCRCRCRRLPQHETASWPSLCHISELHMTAGGGLKAGSPRRPASEKAGKKQSGLYGLPLHWPHSSLPRSNQLSRPLLEAAHSCRAPARGFLGKPPVILAAWRSSLAPLWHQIVMSTTPFLKLATVPYWQPSPVARSQSFPSERIVLPILTLPKCPISALLSYRCSPAKSNPSTREMALGNLGSLYGERCIDARIHWPRSRWLAQLSETESDMYSNATVAAGVVAAA